MFSFLTFSPKPDSSSNPNTNEKPSSNTNKAKWKPSKAITNKANVSSKLPLSSSFLSAIVTRIWRICLTFCQLPKSQRKPWKLWRRPSNESKITTKRTMIEAIALNSSLKLRRKKMWNTCQGEKTQWHRLGNTMRRRDWIRKWGKYRSLDHMQICSWIGNMRKRK